MSSMGASIKSFVCLDLPGLLHFPVKNQRCTIMAFSGLHQQLCLDSQSSKAQVILWPPQRQTKGWPGKAETQLPPSPGDPSPAAGRPLAGQQLFQPTTRPCNQLNRPSCGNRTDLHGHGAFCRLGTHVWLRNLRFFKSYCMR
jgi:hypothetical protein